MCFRCENLDNKGPIERPAQLKNLSDDPGVYRHIVGAGEWFKQLYDRVFGVRYVGETLSHWLSTLPASKKPGRGGLGSDNKGEWQIRIRKEGNANLFGGGGGVSECNISRIHINTSWYMITSSGALIIDNPDLFMGVN